jgi:hypothetical protein
MPGHYGNGQNGKSNGNQTNLMTTAGQFVNRRTGLTVPANTPYHMHPEKGPMEGAVHNPDIPGGTQGHDFFDMRTENGNNNFGKGGGTTKKQDGGYLIGPSHEQGGIPAIVAGTEPIELEGGEYVINGKATAALGTQFLDKLNATANDYHPNIEGFNPGVLPSPSQFERGGKINFQQRNKKLKNGGKVLNKKPGLPIRHRKLQNGEYVPCPTGFVMNDEGVCFKITGNPAQTSAGYSYSQGGTIGGNKMARGGNVNSPNSKRNKRIRQQNQALKRIGGSVKSSKNTSIAVGHSHSALIDEHGNGTTQGGNHTHEIKNHVVSVAFTPSGKGHSHSL